MDLSSILENPVVTGGSGALAVSLMVIGFLVRGQLFPKSAVDTLVQQLVETRKQVVDIRASAEREAERERKAAADELQHVRDARDRIEGELNKRIDNLDAYTKELVSASSVQQIAVQEKVIPPLATLAQLLPVVIARLTDENRRNNG